MGTGYFDGEQEFDGAKSSRQDDHVVLVRLAVVELDAGFRDPLDLVGLEGCLRRRDGGIVVVADNDALAPGIVCWCEFRPHVRPVGDLRAHHVLTERAQHVCECGGAVGHGVVEGFAEVHHAGALAPADGREVAVDCAAEVRHGAVFARNDPVRGALVDGEVFGDWEDFGDDLSGGCSCSLSVVRRHCSVPYSAYRCR